MELKDFQKTGIKFLSERKYGLLADAMGLGKTVQSIKASEKLKDEGKASNWLVITPNSLKYNYANEIEKFSDLSFIVVDGSLVERAKQWKEDSFFKITNYANLLTKDFEEFIVSKRWDGVTLDEATFIKNSRAKRTERAKIIPRKYRWCLSGSPIERSPTDLYNIVEFLHPLFFKRNFWAFRNHYCIMKKLKLKKRTIRIPVGTKNLEELSVNLEPIMLRRRKKDVMESLPEKTYKTISVRLTGEQGRIYDSLREEIKKKADEDECVLGYWTKMRMVCSGVFEDEPLDSNKLNALSDLIDDGLDNCVIFTNWVRSLKMICGLLKEKEKKFSTIYGEDSTEDREKTIRDFNSGKIDFIVCDSAAEYGINLQTAENMVMFDCPWNYSKLQQRIDRVHRIGQKHNVLITFILSKDTIDERVVTTLREKKEMFDTVMNEQGKEEFFIKNM